MASENRRKLYGIDQKLVLHTYDFFFGGGGGGGEHLNVFQFPSDCSQKNSLSCLESCSLNWRRFKRNFSHLQANVLAGEIVYICVKFGPMWTHKDVFGGLLELRTLMHSVW